MRAKRLQPPGDRPISDGVEPLLAQAAPGRIWLRHYGGVTAVLCRLGTAARNASRNDERFRAGKGSASSGPRSSSAAADSWRLPTYLASRGLLSPTVSPSPRG